MSRVLLCTRGNAPELPTLIDALRDRGAEPVVLDSAAFPTDARLSLSYDRTGFRCSGLRGDDRAHDDLSAVWHSLVVGTALPAMEPGSRETCVAASELAMIGLIESLQVFQLDPAWSKQRADNKPYQLALAQRVGLAIPQTLISNDPDAVRAFAAQNGPVIMKMLVQPASTGPSSDETEVVFTTALTDDDLAALDGLDLCPMIFQAQVEHQRDVRVTVVGRRVFGAALDRAARGGDDPDWRRQSYALDRAPRWTPYELPAGLAEPLLRLLDHVGLNYGAVDLLVRPDGTHVFLELNASGSFAFLGPAIATPIAAAIAEVLVDPAARRVPSHV